MRSGPVRPNVTALALAAAAAAALLATRAVAAEPGTQLFVTNPGGFQVAAGPADSAPLADIASPANAWGTAYDPFRRKVYWSDVDAGMIFRSDTDGSDVETVIDMSADGALLRGLQIDAPGRRLYFIAKSAAESGVYTSTLNGGSVSRLPGPAADFFVRPNDLALDLDSGVLFVSDSGLDMVGRFDLAGGGFEPVLGASFGLPGVPGPWGLATDPFRDRLYVTAYDAGEVFSVDYDGGGRTDHLANGHVLRGAALSRDGSRLLVVDATSDTVLDLEIDTGNAAALPASPLDNPRDLAAYLDGDRDGDFLPDSWETHHFGSLSHTDGTGDDDQDGNDDFGELAFGTDPVVADAPDWDAGSSFAGPAPPVRVRFLVREDTPLRYNIYFTPDLASWLHLEGEGFTSSDSPSAVPGYLERVVSYDPPPGSRPAGFLRASASTR